MPGPELTHRLHLSSLAVELPDGWSVFDGATIAPPSGAAIQVRLGRAADGCDSSVLADKAEAEARGQTAGMGDVTKSTVPLLGGLVGEQRVFAFERNGVASIGRFVCLIDDGLALTLTASWPAGDEVVDSEVDVALAGIRLVSRPVATFPTGGGPQGPRPSVQRSVVDASVWTDLRIAWLNSDMRTAERRTGTRLSSIEFAVCATIVGAASFPTVGPELLASLPGAVLNATLDTVTRSFIARGFAEAGEDGFAILSAPLRKLVEVAVFPDLAISIERLGDRGAQCWWFGLHPDRGVQVSVLADGSCECAEIDPSRVIDQIFAVSEIGGAVAESVRVNTAWRDREVIRGGVFTCEPGADVEALRLQLLDHLPGSTT